MKTPEIKIFYRHNLPHYQPVGGMFFVTFRLFGSIPKVKLLNLKEDHELKISQIRSENPSTLNQVIKEERKKFFGAYDKLLDNIKTGPHFLKNPEVAKIIADQLHRFDDELYQLVAYCIMSNHVHILIDTSIQISEDIDDHDFETLDHEPLHKIMKRIKGASAIYVNRLIGRKGKFWQRESYDHHVQSEREFGNIVNYILNNPVTAGLVNKWSDYPYSYVKEF